MRQTRLILAWLVARNIQQTKIAKELSVSNALVSSTIFNRNNNRKVLDKLISLGVPVELLGSSAGRQ